MFHFIVIGMVVVIVAGLALFSMTFESQQELEEINIINQERQSQIITESVNVSGGIDNKSIKISNTSNDDVSIIQIRVYDGMGDFVKSFDVNYIILGNSEFLISDLPQELQGMLVQ